MTGTPCPICQSPLAPGQDPCPAYGAALGLGASAPARNLAVGSTLHQGKFTVGRVLGEGGFGITYKGAHRDLRRPVAIKELFPLDLGATRLGTRVSVPAPQADAFRYARDQALQEARIIAGFRSRNIVDVYDMFLENDTAYIVMEYLEGETLEARLERIGSLPPDEVQGLAEALCEALSEVHDGNWLHRDIKPSNIVLAADQRVVLIDFGSAREFHLHRTQRHTRILTAQYAAPEQYSEEARFGPYTDAFSLGATLYHALTGAPPPSAMDRFQSGRDLDFPPEVPSRLAAALQQALALRVDDRPASMTALCDLLQEPTPTATDDDTTPQMETETDLGSLIPESTPAATGTVLSVPSVLDELVSPVSPNDREALVAVLYNVFNHQISNALLASWDCSRSYGELWEFTFKEDEDKEDWRVILDDKPAVSSLVSMMIHADTAREGNIVGITVDGAGQVIALQIGYHWTSEESDEAHVRVRGLEALPIEIGQLTHLQYLDLSYTPLEALPDEIGRLTCLQHLDLGGTQLEALPDEIGRLTCLQHLDLGGTQLEALPDEIGRLTCLQRLGLGGTRLEVLPDKIGQLARLQSLELGDTRLEALPDEIGQLTCLQYLDLDGTQLKALPDEIGQLTRLQRLELGGTRLEALPDEIGQLTCLQHLDLRFTRLEALPDEIGQLTCLQYLDLRYTRLEALPDEIGQLTCLQHLDLGNTRLKALPDEIGQLTCLQHLDLGGTQLEALPDEIGQLTCLQRLDLSHTRLAKALPDEIGHLTREEPWINDVYTVDNL